MALAAPIRAGSSQLLWNAHLRKTGPQVLSLPLFQNKRLNPPLESTDTGKRGGGHVPRSKPNVRRSRWPALSPSSSPSSGLASSASRHPSLITHHCTSPLRALPVSVRDPGPVRSVSHHSSLITAFLPSSLFPCTYELRRVPARSMCFVFSQLQTPAGRGWYDGPRLVPKLRDRRLEVGRMDNRPPEDECTP
jgi:hypothetical protein